MAPQLNTTVLHIPQLIPGQIPLAANAVGDHVNRGLHASFLQHGQKNGVIVLIAVIKGQNHRLIRQFLLALLGPHKILHGNGGIALCLQIIELLLKLRHRHCIGPAFLIHIITDMMVFEHQYAPWRRCHGQPGNKNQQDKGQDAQPILHITQTYIPLPYFIAA